MSIFGKGSARHASRARHGTRAGLGMGELGSLVGGGRGKGRAVAEAQR